jgi:hypothetical protein
MSDVLSSKIAFVSSDGDGGYLLKMQVPDGQQLAFRLDLVSAARLQGGLADAIAVLAGAKPAPAPANEKYFQK